MSFNIRINSICTLLALSAAIITSESSFFNIKPVYADHCGFLDPTCSHNGCSDLDITCNPHVKPITKPLAENIWGEAGGSAYPAAASIMRGRNGGSQGLDDFQKKNLSPHFGNLVDRVVVIYNARMMDQWSAFGKSIDLSGIDTAAQTYCNRIYVRDAYKPNDVDQLITLSHEMTHSKQCVDLGGQGKFGFHYFREFKRAGLNYENNNLEREASSFEANFKSGLQNLIQPVIAKVDTPPLKTQKCQAAFCDARCPTEIVHVQGETATYKVVICSDEKGRPTHYLGENKTNKSSIFIPITSFDVENGSSKYITRNGKFTYTLILSGNSQLIIKSPGKKSKIEAFNVEQP
jgi:hypothetical protein